MLFQNLVLYIKISKQFISLVCECVSSLINFKIISILNNYLTVLTNLLLLNALFVYLFMFLY